MPISTNIKIDAVNILCMVLPETVQQALDEKGGLENLISLVPDDKALMDKAEIFRALSDTIRLKILYLLSTGTLCVCVIKEALQIADSKLSYHLTILKKAELITSTQQGNWILYTLTEKGAEILEIQKNNPESMNCDCGCT